MGRSAEKKVLIVLGAVALVLLISILWSVNRIGGYFASLNIPRAFLCKEIQKDVAPIPLTEKLYPDQTQVCVWFEYERANIGDKVKIVCYKEKNLITERTISLTSKNGIRAFYLVKKDGAPLPIGNYKVTISTETKELYNFTFDVIEKPKQAVQSKSKSVIKKTKTKAGGAKIAKKKKNNRSSRSSRRNKEQRRTKRRARRRR